MRLGIVCYIDLRQLHVIGFAFIYSTYEYIDRFEFSSPCVWNEVELFMIAATSVMWDPNPPFVSKFSMGFMF